MVGHSLLVLCSSSLQVSLGRWWSNTSILFFVVSDMKYLLLVLTGLVTVLAFPKVQEVETEDIEQQAR